MRRNGVVSNRLTWWVLILLPLLLLAIYVYITRVMMFPGPMGQSLRPARMMLLQSVATVFLVLSIFAFAGLCVACAIRSSLSEKVKNAVLLVLVLTIILLSGELFFLHYERTNGIGMRWSYKLWSKRHFTHRTTFNFINSKGEEDRADFREPIPNLKKKKKSIWFIGDSFTFGFGLENTEQSFPAQVERLLRQFQNIPKDTDDRVICVNLGDGGADIYHEKETLFAFDTAAGQQPYAVVWQYFGDDIDTSELGPDIYENEIRKDPIERFGRMFFRQRSFLLDYIYWEYFRHNEVASYRTYMNFLNQIYLADSIVVEGHALTDSNGAYVTPFSEHLRPLSQSAAYYKGKGSKFLVIIFPYLWSGGPADAERLYTQRLAKALRAQHTDVIDITPLVRDLPLDQRVVNSHDPHPTEMVDKIVADTIAKYFIGHYGMELQ